MFNFRTDLADERRDIYRKANNLENEIPGVETENSEENDIRTTRVKIIDEQGARSIGKTNWIIYYNRYKKFENCTK